ncbi:MAG: response regulator [Bacteroidetes bacterium]|jgi:DNA-binding NtrC family response regulator|nr:response regulator [Bacteroidota bacterium]
MKKEVVFIVDDEPMHAQMMEDHLRTKYPTFDIYKYSTGEECNDNMDKNPSIVILDYHLDAVNKSARNGIQTLEHIKRKYDDVDVIMISGQDKIDVAVECMRSGAYDYIVKNETSFMRTENALERLFKHRHVVTSLAKYKALNKILIWGLVIIVATAAVLYLTGVID